MARRDELVAEWRVRLEECEQALAESRRSPTAVRHWTWLRRMYAQVLRYLIARYGDEGETGVEGFTEPRSRMTYHEAVGIGPGKPARSADTIRSVLDTVHTCVPAVAPGSHLCGPEDPILVESFPNGPEARQARHMLERERVRDLRLSRAGRMHQLWARRADSERARAILAEHGLPRRKRESDWGRFAMAGMAAGAAIGFAAVLFHGLLGDKVFFLIFIGPILGGVVGVMVDVYRASR